MASYKIHLSEKSTCLPKTKTIKQPSIVSRKQVVIFKIQGCKRCEFNGAASHSREGLKRVEMILGTTVKSHMKPRDCLYVIKGNCVKGF